jgi:hypothetical protein
MARDKSNQKNKIHPQMNNVKGRTSSRIPSAEQQLERATCILNCPCLKPPKQISWRPQTSKSSKYLLKQGPKQAEQAHKTVPIIDSFRTRRLKCCLCKQHLDKHEDRELAV